MKESPNCILCTWSKKRRLKMPGTEIEIDVIYCQAQGGQATVKGIYNSRLCQNLYQKRTDALADVVMGKT